MLTYVESTLTTITTAKSDDNYTKHVNALFRSDKYQIKCDETIVSIELN